MAPFKSQTSPIFARRMGCCHSLAAAGDIFTTTTKPGKAVPQAALPTEPVEIKDADLREMISSTTLRMVYCGLRRHRSTALS